MKFIDEAVINVSAGKGGSGCLSFRREKYVARGGPDGGDGGDGGSVYLLTDPHCNTLAEFRFKRSFKAQNGQPGMGKDRRGKSGEDCTIPVPPGTTVHDFETDEFISDLTEAGQRLCVAKGGFHGLGNARYKSSVNQAPRRTSEGSAGEERRLKLELKVLADVGLCGLPNAGKSTLVHAVSNANPKIADYPFTTLHPQLGVVRVGEYQSFVMADIPGLIEGASSGTGLGTRFLKHLSRTGLLLHVVNIAPIVEGDDDPMTAFLTVDKELQQYSEEIVKKERWLVFNKIDLLLEDEAQARCDEVVKALNWQGKVLQISALTRQGTEQLCREVMAYLESHRGQVSSAYSVQSKL